MPKSRRLNNGTIVTVFDRAPAPDGVACGARIVLPSGVIVPSEPQGGFGPGGSPIYSQEQLATARSLGYAGDVLAMVRDHDALHALLADWLGLPTSFALEVAAGLRPNDDLARLEEAAVLAITVYMRKAGGKLPL